MRLSDLPPDVRERVLAQDTKKRPRDRRVARGPYRAQCATCGLVVTTEAASVRHTAESGHCRWESLYPERLCVCPPSVRVLHGDDPSTCYRCSGIVSESFDLVRGTRGYAPSEWL